MNIFKGGAAAIALTLLLAPEAIATPSVKAGPVKAGRVKAGRAVLTFYWVIDETSPQYRGRPTAALRDVRGNVIAHTSRKFRRALVREGTGWLRDGRAVMYDRRVRGEQRFRLARSRYGIAVTGCALVPYRSVAVDPHFIKLGSTIYIPQLKGMRLPDGTIHDGVFFACDRGHFRGRTIDIFLGAGAHAARPFVRKGYGSRSHVTVYILKPDGACRP